MVGSKSLKTSLHEAHVEKQETGTKQSEINSPTYSTKRGKNLGSKISQISPSVLSKNKADKEVDSVIINYAGMENMNSRTSRVDKS